MSQRRAAAGAAWTSSPILAAWFVLLWSSPARHIHAATIMIAAGYVVSCDAWITKRQSIH